MFTLERQSFHWPHCPMVAAFIGMATAACLGAGVAVQAQADTAAHAELPTWKIPNIPQSGEAYYGPDSLHVIAQVQDPDAQRSNDPRAKFGNLTYTFTDRGADIRRINGKGQDACSYFFPDGKRLIWTSTRDNMDLPVGNWSDSNDYPIGAELYISDLDGGNVQRLTHNKTYEAEVSVSPDGKWIVFGRQIDGKMDLWRMRPDGSGEEQLTFTDDWQEGAPFYLPDNRTILLRAWRRSEYGKVHPTPMTVFTLDAETKQITPRTFDHDMNWAPYPTPDGRHYVFVRIIEKNNWEVFLGDIQGGAPVRLTYNEGFDGFPSVSPDGKKMLFTRKVVGDSGLYTWVMDISSLGVGPQAATPRN
ncbi:MAG: PD40 domain-containing protein [Gammaproteobacteria bacterium]|nr:PD40 domain-containing protein [Gammaproteobacteria bacterium]